MVLVDEATEAVAAVEIAHMRPFLWLAFLWLAVFVEGGGGDGLACTNRDFGASPIRASAALIFDDDTETREVASGGDLAKGLRHGAYPGQRCGADGRTNLTSSGGALVASSAWRAT